MSRGAEADGFFVLRTPLLPFDALAACSAAAGAPGAHRDDLPSALARDRDRFQQGVREILARPAVRDALALASPDLAERLGPWVDDGGDPDAKLVRAAVRYVARMCARPTPFGLMAGTTLGSIDGETALELGPVEEARRRTTVEPHFAAALAEQLSADPDVRAHLRLRPSSALYETGGRWRYARGRTVGARRSYDLVAADGGEPLRVVVERARGGASAEELAAVLEEHGADAAQARGYVDALVDAQILEGDLVPPVTGAEPAAALLDRLGSIDGAAPAARRAARGLAAARAALAGIDAGGPGAPRSAYEAVTDALEPLGTGGLDPRRSLVAELVRPARQARLGRNVVHEVARAVETLATLMPAQTDGPLAAWRGRFRERWEDREVPLLLALDEELGVGFEASASPGAVASPAVRGLPWPPREPDQPRFGARGRHLLRRVIETTEAGERELAFDDRDLAVLRHEDHAILPDAFAPLVTLAAGSPEAVARGDFRVRLHGVAGPSGARLLGRVCHASPELADAVRGHLRREEALRPDAVFAEIVHLPEGRTGKLIARPVLRDHEIEFLGRSGARPDAVLDPADLLVSVRGNRVVLRSQRLGREVVPRLSSAQNYSLGSLGLYRFLCTLQGQGCSDGVAWSWGPLEGAPFLPRVVQGRAVLERARWTVRREELAAAADARDDAARWRAVAELRERRGLPRWVALADGDNELALDLDATVAQDTLVRLAAPRNGIRLVELWPDPGELCVTGPGGRYASEMIVPFTRQREAVTGVPAPRPQGAAARRFLPGSEWLYARLYTGEATADAILRDTIAPLVRVAQESGAADRWFFIRYGDPDWHLRLRLHGDPARLAGEVLPALHAACEAETVVGRLWRLDLGTYEREQERYGGPVAVAYCERVFHADSEAALELLALVGGDAGADARWRLALAGIDRVLRDVLGDEDARRAAVRHLREAYAAEHRADPPLRKAVGARFREERAALLALLDGTAEGALAEGLAILERRSAAMAPALDSLRRLDAGGGLEVTLSQLASDLAHMQTNRLLRSAHRAHEMVLYDMLDRLYTARAARGRS